MNPEPSKGHAPEPDPLEEATTQAVKFLLSYVKEPPHVAVILATSRMDYLLCEVLRARLLPVPSASDPLLDSERGIGTLALRIDTAHRLGIIDARLARSLHIFRKLRNDFAHASSGQALDDSPHRDRITELTRDSASIDGFKSAKAKILQRHEALSPCTADFLLVAALAIAYLEASLSYVKPVDSECAERFSWTPE